MKAMQVIRLFDEHSPAVIFETIAMLAREKSRLHHDENARKVWKRIAKDVEEAAGQCRRFKL